MERSTPWFRRLAQRLLLAPLLAPLFALIAALMLSLLQGCAEIDAGLQRAVTIKYAHVANVRMFQATIDNSERQLAGVDNGSFWALFDVCSVDVQGSSLTGFTYHVDHFFIDAGSASYGAGNPGVVNVSSVTQSSQSALVLDAASRSFQLGPRTQFLPKQFYPNLRYRIALFVRERPAGYQGEVMTLRYNGQPQVAALVQNVGSLTPQFRDFYQPRASPPISGACL